MINNALGQYLKKLRKAHGYTQEYIASQLNIIHQTYSHYETGRITPPSDSLFTLSRLYNIPMDSLMELTVNYQLNPDFIPNAVRFSLSNQELNEYLDYIDMPSHQKKFKNLNQREKRLLYFFQQLSPSNQEETIDVLEVKYQHEKKAEKKSQ